MKTKLIIFSLFILACRTGNKTDNGNIVTNSNTYHSADTKGNSENHTNTIPLTILPGKGVDNIKLGASEYSDILKFKNLKFDIDSGEGIACGDKHSYNWFWKSFSNKESGLLIEYSSEWFPELETPKTYARTLSKITVKDNDSATLKNGLRIGTATYSDVVKIFGPIPKEWQNEEYLRFDEKGISFRFGNNSKLSEVEIFKPTK